MTAAATAAVTWLADQDPEEVADQAADDILADPELASLVDAVLDDDQDAALIALTGLLRAAATTAHVALIEGTTDILTLEIALGLPHRYHPAPSRFRRALAHLRRPR